jgi:hypothetical protein
VSKILEWVRGMRASGRRVTRRRSRNVPIGPVSQGATAEAKAAAVVLFVGSITECDPAATLLVSELRSPDPPRADEPPRKARSRGRMTRHLRTK